MTTINDEHGRLLKENTDLRSSIVTLQLKLGTEMEQCDDLRANLETAETNVIRWRDNFHAEEHSLRQAERERDKARAAIRTFGEHLDECGYIEKGAGHCDCGLDAAIEEKP